MSLMLTTYNISDWISFVEVTGFPQLTSVTSEFDKNAVLLPVQTLSSLHQLITQLIPGQQLCLATVQVEHFLADAIITGLDLEKAAQAWKEQTNELLNIQRQNRRQVQLFNLYQAWAYPVTFAESVSAPGAVHHFAAHAPTNNLALLASCQYVAQQPELQMLNAHLQAASLALCETEILSLDINFIIAQHRANQSQLNLLTEQNHSLDSELSNLKQQLSDQQQKYNLLNSENDDCKKQSEIITSELEKLRTLQINEAKKLNSAEENNKLILSQLHQTQKELERSAKANELLKVHYEELKQESITQKQTYDQLHESYQISHDELKAVKEENSLLLGQLHHVQEQLEQYYLTMQAEEQRNKHAMLARDKQYAKDIGKLENELRKVKARAASAEYSGSLLQNELAAHRNSTLWKATQPMRLLGRLVRRGDKSRDKLLQDVGLLLTSEFFDVDWYLKHYPDVAESKMNPAEHYLLYGAAEGRLPGPLFDGTWYLQHYPDVAEAGVNPLLHFITYGIQEGRSSSPKLLANNQSGEE